MGGRSGKIRRNKISIEDAIFVGGSKMQNFAERKARIKALATQRAGAKTRTKGSPRRLTQDEQITVSRVIAERARRSPSRGSALEQLHVARANLLAELDLRPFTPRTKGRPELDERNTFYVEVADRIRNEQGFSIRAACRHVAEILLSGPLSPKRLSPDVWNAAFPNTSQSDPDVITTVAGAIRTAYNNHSTKQYAGTKPTFSRRVLFIAGCRSSCGLLKADQERP